MNKSELIDAVAESTSLSKADAGRALESVLETIKSTLQSGQKVTIPGFGTFGTRERAERQGRHPSTGAPLIIKATHVVTFKAGKQFKDALN